MMTARRFVFGAALPGFIAAAACGGSGSSTVDPAADAALPSESTDEAGAPSPDGSSGASDANAPDAKASADGAPDARVDAAPIDTRLDPIEVGHAWTYNVNVLGFYPACENGIGVATTISKSSLDGKTAFQVQSLCKNAGTFDYAVENDRVYYHHLGEWRLSTDEPVQAGHEWTDDTYDYVWEDAGPQVTAAGTFKNCWTAKRDVSYPSFTTFCRGVGPVHWHYEDGLGNGYDALLVSKNF